MWANGYNMYGNMQQQQQQQQDAQPNNWFNQNMTGAMSNPFGLRLDNYMSGATNPFAGQTFGNTYQPYTNGGYQYRGW